MKQLAIALAGVLAVTGIADAAPLWQGSRATPEDAKTVEGRFNGMSKEATAGVDAFGFEITLEATHKHEYLMQWQEVLLTGQAAKMVSGDVGTSGVEVSQTVRPGLIDLTARKVHRPPLEAWRPARVPEKWFQVRLETLRFPKDRPVYVRLRFRDAEEYFALTFQPDQGLRLAGVKNPFGKVKGSIKDFAILEAGAGKRDYQCDNFHIFAREGDKDLWTRRIPLEGAPKEFRIVGETLFVLSTKGHSLYVRKSDGKIVYYHKGVLAGKSPWDEILEVARDTYARRGPEKAELCRAMGAAALLEEKRAAPFLIECIEKGYGLTERWWAVAALEHLNGNSKHWKKLGEGQPWDPTGRPAEWDMNRVYPDTAMKAETQRWEKVFGPVKVPLLKGPEK